IITPMATKAAQVASSSRCWPRAGFSSSVSASGAKVVTRRPGSGLAVEPAQDRRPVVLVPTRLLGVVVEHAAAEAGHQHVALAVTQLADQRIRPGFQTGHHLLRSVGPRPQ